MNKKLMHFRPNKVLEALAHHQTINTAKLEMVRQNPITPNCNSPNLHSTPLSGSATDEIPRANKVSQQSESELQDQAFPLQGRPTKPWN